jgi:hypothetical protein
MSHPPVVRLLLTRQVVDVFGQSHELPEEGILYFVFAGREIGQGEELSLGDEDRGVWLGRQGEIGPSVNLGLYVLFGAILPGERTRCEVEEHVDERL